MFVTLTYFYRKRQLLSTPRLVTTRRLPASTTRRQRIPTTRPTTGLPTMTGAALATSGTTSTPAIGKRQRLSGTRGAAWFGIRIEVSRVERLGDCFKAKLVCAFAQHWSHLSKAFVWIHQDVNIKDDLRFICVLFCSHRPCMCHQCLIFTRHVLSLEVPTALQVLRGIIITCTYMKIHPPTSPDTTRPAPPHTLRHSAQRKELRTCICSDRTYWLHMTCHLRNTRVTKTIPNLPLFSHRKQVK